MVEEREGRPRRHLSLDMGSRMRDARVFEMSRLSRDRPLREAPGRGAEGSLEMDCRAC